MTINLTSLAIRAHFWAVLFLFIGFTALGQRRIEVTYIANEGFLITSGKDKVLIDGIFNNAYGRYHVPTTLALSAERGALSPFDSLTMVLVSHKHDDHVNKDYVAEHLTKDNKSVLICPSQVSDLIKPLASYATIKNRIIIRNPAFGTHTDTTINNIHVQVMSFHHPNDAKMEIQDIGFLLTINGFKLFHSGDAVNDDLEFFKNLNLAKDSIDIAFMARWYFDTEYGDKGTEIMKYLQPKAIIAMHINTDKYAYYKSAAANIQGIAPVYFMDTPMTMLNFLKDSVSSAITSLKLNEGIGAPVQEVLLYPSSDGRKFILSAGTERRKVAQVDVFSVSGFRVYSKRLELSHDALLDFSYLPKSLYVVRLKIDGMTYTKKLVLR